MAREDQPPYSDDFWTVNAPPGEPPPEAPPAGAPSPTVPEAPPGTTVDAGGNVVSGQPLPLPTTGPAPPPPAGGPWNSPNPAKKEQPNLSARAFLEQLLRAGNSPQEASQRTNQQYGLTTGGEAYYDASRGIVAAPGGGYFSTGAGGWQYAPGDSAGGGGGAGNRYGGFTTPPGFYGSNPNAPTPYEAPPWTGGNFVEPALPTALQTPYHLPTQAELEASPGYQARLNATIQGQQRSAAARGSVLSGGSQVELGRQVQDYASNEYGNLVGQSLSARGQQFGEYQTGRGNLFQDYQTKYGQYLDQANLGQQAYQNRYGAYMNDNARTLSDYLTNVGTQRNWQGDYWNRLKDLRDPGANLSGNSYKPPQ